MELFFLSPDQGITISLLAHPQLTRDKEPALIVKDHQCAQVCICRK